METPTKQTMPKARPRKVVSTGRPKPRETTFNKTDIDIPTNQIAYDPIDGKVNLFTYMEENPDTVAFLYDNEYFITTKTILTRIVPNSPWGDNEISGNNRMLDNSNMIHENFNLMRLLKKILIPIKQVELVLLYAFGKDRAFMNYNQYRLYEIVANEHIDEIVVSLAVILNTDNSNVSDVNHMRLCHLRIITSEEEEEGKSTGGIRAKKSRTSKSTKRKNTTRK